MWHMHVCARVCVGTCVHVPMHMHDKLRGRFIDPQGSPVSAPSTGLQTQVNMPSFGTHARDQDSGLVQHVFSPTPSISNHSLIPREGVSILSRFHFILPFLLSFCPPSDVSPYVSGPNSPSATSELAYLSIFSVFPFPQDPCQHLNIHQDLLILTASPSISTPQILPLLTAMALPRLPPSFHSGQNFRMISEYCLTVY